MDKLRFTRWIEDDLVEALAWYDGKSLKIGDNFRQEVERILDAIEQSPERFALASRNFNVGYLKLRRFPYLVFYQMAGTTPVLVGVLHGASDPEKWLSRVSNQ